MDRPFKVPTKDATSFQEQVKILQSRGLFVEDTKKAVRTLQNINYYRLIAYGLTLKDTPKNEMYGAGATFSQLVSIYEFDKKLRHLLLGALENVEIAFRTHIAYHHAHKYSPIGYKNPIHFQDPSYHDQFMKNLERFYFENKTELFVIHHHKKYEGVFPFWVAIELLSFSTLSMLYKNLLDEDKLLISRTYYNLHFKYIQSWLHTLTPIRNICAHHGRLYGKNLSIRPQLFTELRTKVQNNTLYAAIIALIKLLNNDDRSIFFISLQALVEEYNNHIKLSDIGFPNDWEVIIQNLK